MPKKKINPTHFQNQRYIGIFMSLRERETERERERKSKSESKSNSKSKSNTKSESESKRNRKREKIQAIIFLNRLGQIEKSVNYI